MSALTDTRGAGLSGGLVYRTADNREGFIVFPGYGASTPVTDEFGQVRFAYLAADGSLPDPITGESAWLNPATLTGVRLLPGLLDAPNGATGSEPNPGDCAWCYAFDDDRDSMNVCSTCREGERLGDEDYCPHAMTVAAEEGEPYQRTCTDCEARLYLTDAQNTTLRIRDDGAFYVTSVDGTHTFAGPFLDWEQANAAAEAVEDGHGGLVATDIRFENR